MKGYCVILVLVLPRSFASGGFACTAGLVLVSGLVSTFCACLLVQAGLQANVHSYSLLTQKVLGPKWKVAVDLIIALAQFSFTVSHISFIIQSLRTTVDAQLGMETPVWPYLAGVLSVLTPIAWVEDIKKFSFTFLVGNLLILSTIITVSSYCIWLIVE